MKSGTPSRGSLGLVFAIFAESLLSPAGIHIVSPSLALMGAEFADDPWAKTLVPMVITLPGLLIALCAPMMGAVSDRLGVRPLLIGSTLVYLTVGILPYWLNSLPAIVASRFVFGVAESALAVCGPPLIAAAFIAGKRRAMIGGRLAVIGTASLGLALAGGWAAGYGWRAAYLLYGLAIIPLALILLFVPKLERVRHERASLASFRPLIPILALTAGYGTGIATVYVFVPFLLKEIGSTSAATASLYSGMSAVTTAIGAITYPLLQRLIRRHILIAASFVVMAAGSAIMWVPDIPYVVAVGVFAISLGMGVFVAIATELVLELSPPYQRGTATGLMLTSVYLGSFLAPFAFHGMMSHGLKLQQVYLIVALFYALLAVAGLLLRDSLQGKPTAGDGATGGEG